jgi:hypothetical protein
MIVLQFFAVVSLVTFSSIFVGMVVAHFLPQPKSKN